MKKNIDEYAQQAMFLADEFIQFSLLKSVQNENTRTFKRCIIYVFISHGQCLKKFLQLFYITRILILGNLTHTILLISHIYILFQPSSLSISNWHHLLKGFLIIFSTFISTKNKTY